ncbi:hypothetical protein chiPu_0014210 [Chiloscyllium punctatum]|uniref:Uncharacterized protein n=1 Tax=Chiloscyllium punctatum TaxID=137246 RepID=A0A401SZA2_CHIPU|nr:hypothetical protein [Chiloscyllium punctatum]
MHWPAALPAAGYGRRCPRELQHCRQLARRGAVPVIAALPVVVQTPGDCKTAGKAVSGTAAGQTWRCSRRLQHCRQLTSGGAVPGVAGCG